MQQYLGGLMSSKAETYRTGGVWGRRYLQWEGVASSKEKIYKIYILQRKIIKNTSKEQL